MIIDRKRNAVYNTGGTLSDSPSPKKNCLARFSCHYDGTEISADTEINLRTLPGIKRMILFG